MSEVRIGFVGAGGNARGHMGRIAAIDGVSIVGIADVVEELAEETSAEYGATAYTSHHELLDREALDGLYVSIPPFAHTDAEVLAAAAGVALFVEKPVVLDMDKGFEVLEAIKSAGVLSSVGYQLRLLDSTERLRAYLADKSVAMISSHRWGGLPGTAWWRVMDKSGGQLHEQTTHQLDVMRYVMADEVVSVTAHYSLRAMSDVEGITIPDSQAVLMEFASGTLATISTSPMMTQGGGKSDIVFLLRDQMIEWSAGGVKSSPEQVAAFEGEMVEMPNIDEMFVAAIRAGDQSLIPCSYEDGLRTCAITLAANESAATGKTVKPAM